MDVKSKINGNIYCPPVCIPIGMHQENLLCSSVTVDDVTVVSNPQTYIEWN